MRQSTLYPKVKTKYYGQLLDERLRRQIFLKYMTNSIRCECANLDHFCLYNLDLTKTPYDWIYIVLYIFGSFPIEIHLELSNYSTYTCAFQGTKKGKHNFLHFEHRRLHSMHLCALYKCYIEPSLLYYTCRHFSPHIYLYNSFIYWIIRQVFHKIRKTCTFVLVTTEYKFSRMYPSAYSCRRILQMVISFVIFSSLLRSREVETRIMDVVMTWVHGILKFAASQEMTGTWPKQLYPTTALQTYSVKKCNNSIERQPKEVINILCTNLWLRKN